MFIPPSEPRFFLDVFDRTNSVQNLASSSQNFAFAGKEYRRNWAGVVQSTREDQAKLSLALSKAPPPPLPCFGARHCTDLSVQACLLHNAQELLFAFIPVGETDMQMVLEPYKICKYLGKISECEHLFVNFAIPISVCFLDHFLENQFQFACKRLCILVQCYTGGAGGLRSALISVVQVTTFNSSSVMVSPISLATRLKFFNEILPVSSSSNNLNGKSPFECARPQLLWLPSRKRSLPESLEDLFPRISFRHFRCHHSEEFVEVDCTGAVLVYVGDHFLDFLFFGFEAKGSHSNLELLSINALGTICIEQIEGFFDLLLLFFSELGFGSSISFASSLSETGHLVFYEQEQ